MASRTLLSVVLMLSAASIAGADELTKFVQEDLQELGYDVGAVDGEFSTKTAIAISQFQAENNLEVTGEVSPQLVGVVKAARRGKLSAAPAPAAAAAPTADSGQPPVFDPMMAAQEHMSIEARRQACIEEKMAEAQAKQKKKRGFGKLMRAASRIASRTVLGVDVQEAARDIYDANATAEDLAGAAKDLGITEDELEECRDPAPKGMQ